MRLPGVDAGAGVDLREFRSGSGDGDFEGAVHLVWAVADADGEDGADAGGVRTGEDLRKVFGGVHIEMGVRVDEVHGSKVQGTRFAVRGTAREGVVGLGLRA